ncbi:unnamed protein product [Brachionus calyciflorus]|uniref:Nuclear RNA export factor 1 n=1 Tax=Brachionus calyciflorus TaxID=104777 RepID=A0A813WJM8_9BILA|nr:unnamed protein product [Brachionus calyciflorus]
MPKRNKNKHYRNNQNDNNYRHPQTNGGVNQKWSKKHNKNQRQLYLKPSQLGAIDDFEVDNNQRENNNNNYQHRKNKIDRRRIIENVQDMGLAKTKLSIGDTDEIKKTLLESKPHCKLSYIPDDVFKLIIEYVQLYFNCYDSNREGLLQAYNPKCIFSLCLNMSSQCSNRAFKFDDVYYRENRNLKKLCGHENYHNDRRMKLIHQGYIDTVNFLSKLPPTEHEATSFKLDNCFFMPNMISFSVSGVFREGKSTDKVRPLRSFYRSFVCIPDAVSKMTIVNDQYVISNISVEQNRKYFQEKPKTESAPSESVVASQSIQPDTIQIDQNMLIQRFSSDSRLNFEWSKYCLEHANWNYEEAGKMYMEYKDKIPKEAFLA